jgi:hypothetical protein
MGEYALEGFLADEAAALVLPGERVAEQPALDAE